MVKKSGAGRHCKAGTVTIRVLEIHKEEIKQFAKKLKQRDKKRIDKIEKSINLKKKFANQKSKVKKSKKTLKSQQDELLKTEKLIADKKLINSGQIDFDYMISKNS